MAVDKLKYSIGNASSTTYSTSVSDSDTSHPLTSDTNFNAKSGEGMVILDEGQATEEFAYSTGKSGSSLTIPLANRGLEGTSAAAHSSGATVKGVFTALMWNDMIDTIKKWFDKSSGAVSPALGSDANGDIYYRGSGVLARLPIGSEGQVLTVSSSLPAWSSSSGGTSYWTTVPGTPTRVSDTQFTITDTSNANSYDLLFKKGTILRWLESSTINTGMVISSSYATNTVTINIVGDSLSVGFTAMKYCIQMAQTLDFVIPGTLATGTDLARTHYATTDLIKLSVDAYVKTAGTTNATVFDVNDDGTTIITTKPSIASGATSDIDNTCDAPTTVIAQDSLITVDIDSVSTTAPVEAYIKLFVYPKSWLYRS